MMEFYLADIVCVDKSSNCECEAVQFLIYEFDFLDPDDIQRLLRQEDSTFHDEMVDEFNRSTKMFISNMKFHGPFPTARSLSEFENEDPCSKSLQNTW